MNCRCKAELELKLTERFRAATPDANNHAVRLQGYGYGVTDSGVVVTGFMETKATAAFSMKKGGNIADNFKPAAESYNAKVRG